MRTRDPGRRRVYGLPEATGPCNTIHYTISDSHQLAIKKRSADSPSLDFFFNSKQRLLPDKNFKNFLVAFLPSYIQWNPNITYLYSMLFLVLTLIFLPLFPICLKAKLPRYNVYIEVTLEDCLSQRNVISRSRCAYIASHFLHALYSVVIHWTYSISSILFFFFNYSIVCIGVDTDTYWEHDETQLSLIFFKLLSEEKTLTIYIKEWVPLVHSIHRYFAL